MTGRGVDQILPHPSAPRIYEPWIRNAVDYVELAEAASGPIPRPVDFAYVWGDALPELAAADVRIVNLETAVTADGEIWPDKGIHYRMHPDNVACLRAANVDVCALANNHALDWGRGALVETLECLHQAGIKTTGAGRDRAQAEQPAVVDVGPTRVAVLGVGASSSGIPCHWAATPARPGVALLRDGSERDADAVGERVVRAKRAGDVVVASVHWGSNWGYEVPDEWVAFAHALVERGVDVVHGHSSHHPRPIEVHRGRLVLYGCGDFVDDYEGIPGHESFRPELVALYLARVDDTGQLLSLRIVPLRIRRMRLQRASSSEAAFFAEMLSRISDPYGSRVVMLEDGSLALTQPARD
jgi:poly-gamma-glutamate synthesis protein (capsule biosynthesis protein)